MARVDLEHVRKEYDNGHVAVHDASLAVKDGEFMVLVGPSGCGKSTTLRMIAGLESITDGTIRIGDRVVNDVEPKDRDIAMVFQNYALYPHLSVFDNMAFGLKLRKRPKAEIARRVQEAADILGLGAVLDRKPKALSGGQRQRVALGRAIVREPAVFLFDEPLSNLDAKLRVQTRAEISKLHRALGATMVYVTHDQVEAMTMGDRICVLHDGHVQQVAAPLELYDRPANTFVAGFVGSPAMNLLHGHVEGGVFTSDDAGVRIAIEDGFGDFPVTLGIRPDDLYAGEPARAGLRLSEPVIAIIDLDEPMGPDVVVYLSVPDGPSLVARVQPQRLEVGAPFSVRLDLDRVHLFHRETGERIEPTAA
ncbi:ABC transporter ATP-binding protein [Rubrivirga sp. IMCC45206]|uniref:ABC transporter ATP-binding protein n=1 Tax=Rubrivirga sp. IMCC45206 TaxID=3391614 RepID=UPI00398FC955